MNFNEICAQKTFLSDLSVPSPFILVADKALNGSVQVVNGSFKQRNNRVRKLGICTIAMRVLCVISNNRYLITTVLLVVIANK